MRTEAMWLNPGGFFWQSTWCTIGMITCLNFQGNEDISLDDPLLSFTCGLFALSSLPIKAVVHPVFLECCMLIWALGFWRLSMTSQMIGKEAAYLTVTSMFSLALARLLPFWCYCLYLLCSGRHVYLKHSVSLLYMGWTLTLEGQVTTNREGVFLVIAQMGWVVFPCKSHLLWMNESALPFCVTSNTGHCMCSTSDDLI